MSHVLGVMDIKIIVLDGTQSEQFWNAKAAVYCKKLFIVLSVSGRILYHALFDGRLSDFNCLAQSEFGKKLEDPTNPLQLPGQMKFRADQGIGCVQPVFIGDLSFDYESPYMVRSTACAHVNHVRLDVERCCGRLCKVHGFLRHDVPLANAVERIECSIRLFNFRHCMPISEDNPHTHSADCGHDHNHVCNSWCVHNEQKLHIEDNTRVTSKIARVDAIGTLISHWGDHSKDAIVYRQELKEAVAAEACNQK